MAKLPNLEFKGYLAYTCIYKPALKYESTTDYQYKATIVISEEDAKAFKRLKLNKEVKETVTEEFEDKFKFPVPFPDQEYQYSFTVSQNTHKANGGPMPDFTRPQAFQIDPEDGMYIDITNCEIGNGSYGTLEASQFEYKNKVSLKLVSVKLETLVEPPPRTSWEGKVKGSRGEAVAQTPAAPPKASSPEKASTFEDDDVPF